MNEKAKIGMGSLVGDAKHWLDCDIKFVKTPLNPGGMIIFGPTERRVIFVVSMWGEFWMNFYKKSWGV